MIAATLTAALLTCVAGVDATQGEAREAAQRASQTLSALDLHETLWTALLCGADESGCAAVRAEASQVRRDARQARDLWRAVSEPVAPELLAERAAALRSELPMLEAIGSALEDLLVAAPDDAALRGAGQRLSNARPHATPGLLSFADAVTALLACQRGDLNAATEALALLANAPSRYRLIARLGIARLACRTGQVDRAKAILEAIIAEQVSTGTPMSERILAADVADACQGSADPDESGQRWLALLETSRGNDRGLVRRALPSRIRRLAPDAGTSLPSAVVAACRAANEEDCAGAVDLVQLTRSADPDAAAIAALSLAECAVAGGVSPGLAASAADSLESFSQTFPTDPDAESIARSLVVLRQAQSEAEPLARAFDVLASCAADSATATTARINAAVVRIDFTLSGSPWMGDPAQLKSLADLISTPTAPHDHLGLAAAARLRAALGLGESELCDLVAAAQAARRDVSPSVSQLLESAIQLAQVLGVPCPETSALAAEGKWLPGVATALAESAGLSFCLGDTPAWITRATCTALDEPLPCAMLAQLRGDYSAAEAWYRMSLEASANPEWTRVGLAECLIERGGEAALAEAVALARSSTELAEVGSPGWWRGNLAELEAIVAAGRNSPQVAAKLARLRESHVQPECPALATRFARLTSP